MKNTKKFFPIPPYFLLIFLLSLLLFSNVSSYDHWTHVSDSSFNWETSDTETKWLLFFYKENATLSDTVYSLLNSLLPKYMDKPVGFCLIDSKKNPWLVQRFNVTYLPKILLLENNVMYNFHSHYNEKNIMNFIDKKKPIEYGSPIPKGANLKKIYGLYGPILSHKINSIMQRVINKLHLPITWNKYYTFVMIIIVGILLFIIWLLLFIIYCKILYAICCCGLCQISKIDKNEIGKLQKVKKE